jgi:hydroxymethylbilane synthase
MNSTVLITREVTDHSPLARMARSEGWELQGIPFITTQRKALPKSIPATDWIFFSSGQAVKYFFQQRKGKPKAALAAIGRGTARALKEFGEPAFVGADGSTHEVAKAFAAHIGEASVLFPISNASVRTVQLALKPEQVHEVICYTTEEAPKVVGTFDVVVFSSPSNVEAYFKHNAAKSYQKWIAFGATTAEKLAAFTQLPITVLPKIDDDAIAEAIKATLNS